jgi:4-hydroxy-3-polyprenylbenzoate decarboxylase
MSAEMQEMATLAPTRPNARYTDLRDFLVRCDAAGELKHISGAHWDLEMCAISELYGATTTKFPPALLFDDVPGYPKGFRVLWGTTNSPARLAEVYGFPQAGSAQTCTQAYRDRMKKSFSLIPPKTVGIGPVFENIDSDDKVDLFKFPVPRFHPEDGGRYIGTHDLVIMRDPDTGWVNVATYRIMIQGKDSVSVWMSPGKHGRLIRDKYFAQGKPCPVAISVGTDPLIFLIAGSEIEYGVNEYAYAGGHQGFPIEVVESELHGLPIPATDEIVLEGEILPDLTGKEGPFGEFTGYFASGEMEVPVARIRRVYYRKNPIITVARPGRPPHDYTFGKCVTRSATIWDQVERAGLAGVKGVWSHEPGGARMFNVIAIQQLYAGHARQAGHLVNNVHSGNYMGRWTIVVDEDVDPTNLFDVTWALATRCDPATDIEVLNHQWSGPLDPLSPPGSNMNTRAIVDACRPWAQRDSFPPVVALSRETLAAAREKWGRILNIP